MSSLSTLPPPEQRAALPPGFSPARIAALLRRTVVETGLDLRGLTVLTEAATGAYAVTPVAAALGGARRVLAFARHTRHGSIAEIRAAIDDLCAAAGVGGRVEVVEQVTADMVAAADIVTNSGHLRPIDATLIERLPPAAVIALMYEAWELRDGDIDLAACARRGIPVAAVNERHPSLDVFSYLGPLCVRELHDCGLPVHGNRIALVCDNDFGPSILRSLHGMGGRVARFAAVEEVPAAAWDAVIIALTPGTSPRVGRKEIAHLAAVVPPDGLVVQFWGDVDRPAAAGRLTVWPQSPPAAGHMAVLLSDIGPDAIVRLQVGGLRAAEWIHRGGPPGADAFAELVRLP